MCRIIACIHSCIKKGEAPRYEMLKNDGPYYKIPYPYWCVIIEELKDSGFIKKNITLSKGRADDRRYDFEKAYVTIASLEFSTNI